MPTRHEEQEEKQQRTTKGEDYRVGRLRT